MSIESRELTDEEIAQIEQSPYIEPLTPEQEAMLQEILGEPDEITQHNPQGEPLVNMELTTEDWANALVELPTTAASTPTPTPAQDFLGMEPPDTINRRLAFEFTELATVEQVQNFIRFANLVKKLSDTK